jgi:hypothetical protein
MKDINKKNKEPVGGSLFFKGRETNDYKEKNKNMRERVEVCGKERLS